jgi:CHAD domain-containing protein
MTPHRSHQAEEKARERLQILADSLRRAAKHPGKAESIHDLRVAIRRFTQVLRVFDGLFNHPRKMRHALRGVMDLCGEARNCDIAPGVLTDAGVPPDSGLEKRLKRRRARAGRDLAKLLDRWRVHSHMRLWQEWLRAQPSDAQPGDAQAHELLPRLSREFFTAGREAAKAGAGFRRMHRFRLLVKKLRYTIEIVGGEVLGSGEAQLDRLRGLQERLGAINDCVTTADLIDDIGLGAGGRRKIKAALNRLLERRAVDFRIYWRIQVSPKRTASRTRSRRKK